MASAILADKVKFLLIHKPVIKPSHYESSSLRETFYPYATHESLSHLVAITPLACIHVG